MLPQSFSTTAGSWLLAGRTARPTFPPLHTTAHALTLLHPLPVQVPYPERAQVKQAPFQKQHEGWTY